MKAQTIYDGKYIQLKRRGSWEYVARKNICGIVGIVAVTRDRKLLLVEQYRPPVDRIVIELPAGLAGDIPHHAIEPLESAAHRELLEETGYQAEAMEFLTDGAASAGITDEIITLFRATGLKKLTNDLGDGAEQITLHEIPLDEVDAWLVSQRNAGKLIDWKVFGALHFTKPPT